MRKNAYPNNNPPMTSTQSTAAAHLKDPIQKIPRNITIAMSL